MKKKIKRVEGSITNQIERPFIIITIILVIFNAVFLFAYNIVNQLKSTYTNGSKLAVYTAKKFEEYKSIDFLVDYWLDHADEMELTHRNRDKLEQMEQDFETVNSGYYSIRGVTSEEARNLDPESQKLFAEICYTRLCDNLDGLKNDFDCMYLYTFRVEDGKMRFLCTGAKQNERRTSEGGEIYELGSEGDYTPGNYPILDKIVNTHMRANSLELSFRPGADNEVVHVFEPVYSRDNKMVMITGVSMEWKSILIRSLKACTIIIITSIIMIFSAGIAFYRVIRMRAVLPLIEEEEIMDEYVVTKDSKAVMDRLLAIETGNEVEAIAKSFASVVSELDRYLEEIRNVTAEKERIGAELNVATKIQADMLPSIFPPFPDRNEFDIYASMDPAKEVGGDFYDFFLIDDDHLALVIADVSGKGVPAALFMVVAKTLIKNNALMGIKTPAKIFEKVNEQLLESNEESLFVTVWMGILTISTGKMICSNAGHEYPVIKRKDGDFELIDDEHGIPLATLPDMEFTDYELELLPGDVLFTYTDGVPESSNEEEELFGTDRMIKNLNDDKENVDVRDVNERISAAISAFVGKAPQFDDITMLNFNYYGKEGRSEKEEDDKADLAGKKDITVKATRENFEQIIAFIDKELDEVGCDEKSRDQLDIAVEEIYINVASYAYPEEAGDATISFGFDKDKSRVIISIKDAGIPYDPLEKSDPDIDLSVEERDIGGLGIYMVKNSMDDVRYERKEGHNIFTMEKVISTEG